MNKIKLLIITVSTLLSLHGFSQAPAISYGSNTLTFTKGLHVGPIFPTNTGGAAYAFGQTITFVGSTTGTAGNSNGTGTGAAFYRPFSLVPDPSGNLYLSDGGNNKIRIISTTGVVTTLAANASGGTELNYPTGLSRDASGNLYVAEYYGTSISMVTTSGVVSRVAGNGTKGYVDGPAASAEFNFPIGTAVDVSGNIYVSDWGNNAIRKITPSGTVSTFAGNGTAGYVNGTGTVAEFNHPSGLIFDAAGNLYVADEYNQVIRKITPAGVVSTLSGSGNEGYLNGTSANADFFFPSDIAQDAAGNFYVADYGNRVVRKIGTDGTVSTLAGTAQTSGLTDGIGTAATFNTVEGVTVGIDGNVYVADWGNDNIREIITGGYSISQSLPTGLAFDRNTGGISGTPTVLSTLATYAVTARNASGAYTTSPGMDVVPSSNFNPSQNQNYIVTYIPRVSGIIDTTTLNVAKGDMNQVQIGIQYIDGLGRPMQTVQVKGSAMGNDVVQAFVYDKYGRDSVKYLPYAFIGTADGSYKTDALTTGATSQVGFYTSPQTPVGVSPVSNPQSKIAYETSPFNRPVEQGFAGDAWQLTGTVTPSGVSGHTIKILYGVNDISQYYAIQYNVTTDANANNTLSNSGNYNAGELELTITQNENWTAGQTDSRLNTTEEYKDKEGHVVLKRTYNINALNNFETLSTYYVYDDIGNLAYVLPPASNPDGGLTSVGDLATLNNLCYQYSYDERNRLIFKKIPGKGVEEMVYNLLDQIVFDRDANERNAGQWNFTKYDGQGRVIMTGITRDTSSRAPLQSFVTNILTGQTYAEWESPNPGAGVQGYTNNAFPFGNNVVPLKVNYYDDYSFQGQPATFTTPTASSLSTKGLLTATKTAVLNTINNAIPDMLWTVSYYDYLGRSIQGYTQHYLGGVLSPYNYDIITSAYDYPNFVHELTGTTRQHSVKNTNNTAATLNATIINSYVYDQIDRKIQTLESINGGTNVVLSQTDYNEIGQVMTKHLHSNNGGGSFLQDIAYTYNERGWLLSSSAPLFQEQFQYNKVNGVSGITPAAQYNGNIASQSWGTGIAPNSKSYTYTYDNLNRLLGGTSTDNNNETGITYDLVGNITALNRYQANTLIDQLSYTYTNNGNYTNQVQNIVDGSGNNTGLTSGTMSYTYDANGNMLSNSNTAITNQNKSFTYNLLNLPLVATIATGTATYTYDASGTKLRKVDVLNGVTKTTDYISGIEYDNSTTTIGFIQTEEGKAVSGTGGFDYTYYLGDNLGNTRVTFDTQTGVAAVLQQDDYYPFGLEINHIVSSPKNEYLYNKKELQEELGQYDYGARFYDPVIGRWTSVDPMVEAGQESTTPYGYVFDDPISHTDPDGKVPCCDLEISILEAGFTAAGEVEGGSLGSGTPIAGGIIIGTIGAVASVYIGEHLPSYSGSIGTAHSGGVPVMQRDAIPNIVPERPAIVQTDNGGRTGKQQRLKDVANDPKESSANKGWVNQELNQIARGKRTSIRNPPGKQLAHRRGKEAAKGYSYKHSDLQNEADHKNQHKHDDNGKKNKENPN